MCQDGSGYVKLGQVVRMGLVLSGNFWLCQVMAG